METFKKVKVLLLPISTQKLRRFDNNYQGRTFEVICLQDDQLFIKNEINWFGIPQHLYFTSTDPNEEIKEGDWFFTQWHDSYGKGYIFQHKEGMRYLNPQKIIAITDKLPNGRCCGVHAGQDCSPDPLFGCANYPKLLPQPSQSFIEKYVEQYNKGNQITSVLVEYEDISLLPFNDGRLPIWRKNLPLKINPKDNTITIKKVKSEWSREEVEDLINSFADYHNISWLSSTTKQWISKNL